MRHRLPPTRLTRPGRSGFTLIQTLGVISILGVLLSFSGTVLFRLVRQEAVLAARTRQAAVWTRLADDFRRDAHIARSVELTDPAGAQLVFASAEGKVMWTIDGATLRRFAATTPIADLTRPHETYALAPSVVRFLVTQRAESHPLADIVVTAPEEVTFAPQPGIGSVSAAVGFSHRFEQQ